MAKEQGIPKVWESIDNIKADKLGKTEKASDSELLDGHDSSYFARQSDMDNKYNKSGGLLEGDIIMLPNRSIRIRKDSNVPYGEYSIGYVTATDTFFSGMASSKYLITSSENPKVKVGSDEFTLYHTGNCPISQSQNGWVKFANGLIVQWGKFTIGGNDTVASTRSGTSTLPMAFSNSTYCIIGSGSVTGNNSESNFLCRPSSTNSFDWFLTKGTNTSVFYIIAIGY